MRLPLFLSFLFLLGACSHSEPRKFVKKPRSKKEISPERRKILEQYRKMRLQDKKYKKKKYKVRKRRRTARKKKHLKTKVKSAITKTKAKGPVIKTKVEKPPLPEEVVDIQIQQYKDYFCLRESKPMADGISCSEYTDRVEFECEAKFLGNARGMIRCIKKALRVR